MHVEKFGNEAVESIELGKVFVFPKLDGTNSSVWAEDVKICGGSRTRELSLESDNAGFYRSLTKSKNKAVEFVWKFPHLRLYGEWLVPHSFKGYREDAWRKFYIFDVFNDETNQYLSYDVYQPLLEQFGLDYITPLAIVNNGDYSRFLHYLETNFFLCPDGGSPGEGVVLKNYDFYNKYGDQVWAKIVRQEFKELHHRTMGAPEINNDKMNEERILDKTLTLALVDKTLAKMILDCNSTWASQMIPKLFGMVFYDIVKEELFDALKDIGFGTVNFKTLKTLMIMRIKQMKPELF